MERVILTLLNDIFVLCYVFILEVRDQFKSFFCKKLKFNRKKYLGIWKHRTLVIYHLNASPKVSLVDFCLTFDCSNRNKRLYKEIRISINSTDDSHYKNIFKIFFLISFEGEKYL